MLSTLHGCSSRNRHVEIMPSAYQWSNDRDERTSVPLRFFSPWFFGNGINTNFQRITGITDKITLNFKCSGSYNVINPYYPYYPWNIACWLTLSYVAPSLSSFSFYSEQYEYVKAGSNIPIETTSDGYVIFNNSYSDLKPSIYGLPYYSNQVQTGEFVKINYSSGGINPSNYYLIKNVSYDGATLSFKLIDSAFNDITLTNSSGTTNSLLRMRFPYYSISGGESGRPVRGSWNDPYAYYLLTEGDNFYEVTNGVYIWFTSFRWYDGPFDRVCRIYNETFKNRRGNSSQGQSYVMSNLILI